MKVIQVALWELVLVALLAGASGAALQSCIRPAHADEGIPGITFSANRMACALEGIQHALERLERHR